MAIGYLKPLSFLYWMGLETKRNLLRSKALPEPVISVGNLSVGGRAKTPLVIYIAQKVKEMGFQPVVLTRGYKRKSKERIFLFEEKRQNPSADDVGDEAVEIYLSAPCSVLVHSRRYESAKEYIKKFKKRGEKPVFILDDGFQHWRLERDLDILILDPEDYSDDLLPAGRLREPFEAAGRADLCWQLGKDLIRRTVLPEGMDPSLEYLAVTTRAQSQGYFAHLKERLKNLECRELTDHAPEEAMRKAFARAPHKSLILGAKEAVKVLAASEFRDLLIKGSKSVIIAGSKREIYLARLQLELRDESGFLELVKKVMQAKSNEADQ